ncbi:type II toxin-antitoxin system RelE family toxin [Aggregatibacter kilianii]|uniref:type II toxin-antitoxin system RelE family toxin n=1 Tax=Aggregatibacter kilianii TaxID=2025884 RepID=UPI000D655E40|nr:type II toxin-antitoxin system RelE/ParE family toxin [Aggregatibacter kilianii]
MTYAIEFIPSSEKEFRKLHCMKDCYKIKLRNVGYRLVYQVIDERIVVKVIAVGKRERNFVYNKAKSRL